MRYSSHPMRPIAVQAFSTLCQVRSCYHPLSAVGASLAGDGSHLGHSRVGMILRNYLASLRVTEWHLSS